MLKHYIPLRVCQFRTKLFKKNCARITKMVNLAEWTCKKHSAIQLLLTTWSITHDPTTVLTVTFPTKLNTRTSSWQSKEMMMLLRLWVKLRGMKQRTTLSHDVQFYLSYHSKALSPNPAMEQNKVAHARACGGFLWIFQYPPQFTSASHSSVLNWQNNGAWIRFKIHFK